MAKVKIPSMRRQLFLCSWLLLALATASAADHFTPVIASTLTLDARPVPGTDGRWHLVYELVITNTNPTPATLQKIVVVAGGDQSTILASYEGKELVSRLHTMAGDHVKDANFSYSESRLFLIDFSVADSSKLPTSLLHQFSLMGAATPARQPADPKLQNYTAAPIKISRKLPVIGPPLAGKHWVAINGCCGPDGAHRATGLPVNGQIYFAQRFAIDWMQLDDAGRLVHGDPADVHSYTSYGAEVLAVADGVVVDTLNTLDNQIPGKMPDPKTITIENVDGNHVVIDIGDGVYAFYAHLQKDSVNVQPGARVKRGDVLGKLGNTGNTSAPHLHFHLMEGSSVLGSNGIPYVLDAFELAGQVSKANFENATGIEGDWSKGLLTVPSPRSNQFPLDLNIVNFAERK